MDKPTFDWLYKWLPMDIVIVVMDYYNDLLRNELLEVFKSYFYSYIVTSKDSWDGHKLYTSWRVTKSGFTNMTFCTIITYDSGNRRYKYTVERKVYYGWNNLNRRGHYMGTHDHKMNRCNLMVELREHDKMFLMHLCEENNIKVYKSWNKPKIITALLKC